MHLRKRLRSILFVITRSLALVAFDEALEKYLANGVLGVEARVHLEIMARIVVTNTLLIPVLNP